MEPITTLWLQTCTHLHLQLHRQLATLPARLPARLPTRDERGDVPGWVLITVMTLTLGFGLFKIAGPELNSMLRSALNSVQ